MYAHRKIFTICLQTFEIPDFVQFQNPKNLFSEPVQPLVHLCVITLRAVGELFSPMVSGWVGGGKKFVWAVSQKPYGVGS